MPTISVSETLGIISKDAGIGRIYDSNVPSTGTSGSLTFFVRQNGKVHLGQLFKTSHEYKISGVSLILTREGNPGTVTVSIREVETGSPYPNGTEICFGTFNGNSLPERSTLSAKKRKWTFINFNDLIQLEKYKTYGIVITWEVLDHRNDPFNTVGTIEGLNSPNASGINTQFYKYGHTTFSNRGDGVFHEYYNSRDIYFKTWGVEGLLNDADPLNIYVVDTLQLLDPIVSTTKGLNTKYIPT